MTVTVDPSYAQAQLARAFATRALHEDAATRVRADARMEAWTGVLAGMLSGTLRVGSRTPTGAPAWVTLEVLRGGFASGAYAAGGALLPHETERLARLGHPADERARAVLNASYLDEAGLAELGALLDSGCYRVEVPEEAALLVVAALLRAGDRERAAAVMEQLAPWLDQLRFYPQPAERPLELDARVCRQTVDATIEGLESLGTPPRVMAMNETLAIWAPLSDRAVALVLETIDGPLPSQRGDVIEGGLPLGDVSAEWSARVLAFLAEYAALRARYPGGRKVDRPGESFCELRRVLAIASSGASVTEADRRRARSILAHIARKRGLPGAPRLAELRASQARQAERPLHAALRAVVIERLRQFPLDGGLASLDGLLDPTPEGLPVPRTLERRVARSLEAPIGELVARGVLPSPETLAEVTPQLSAFVKASAFGDGALRRLYGATYLAFRARRSLLLLDLASQVRLEELPWVEALESQRGPGLSAKDQALETLRMLVLLVLDAFPHVIFPNPLVTELDSLAEAAGFELLLVEEIAADIFMGSFVDKFLGAAVVAAQQLEGTVYERYYDARFAEVRALAASANEPKRRFWQRSAPASEPVLDFAGLCRARADLSSDGRPVVNNGKILEQEQLLTTHNLAVVFEALKLHTTLGPRLPELARSCFTWIVGRAPQTARTHRKAQLQARKNMAYAWRQMVFFLAHSIEAEQHAFAGWALRTLEEAPPEVGARLSPYLRGLVAVLMGARIEDTRGAERFLGWTSERVG